LDPENPENDTGILVAYLSQTIEESRRLRENLQQGLPDANGTEPRDVAPPPLEKDDGVTSPDPLSPPG
jgi:hypothetical protein